MDADAKLFNKAIKLRDKNQHDDAINLFKEFVRLFPDHPKKFIVYFVIAGIYKFGKEDYKRALFYAKKGKKYNSNYEPLSVSIYLSYLELEEDEKAINEISYFLKLNKANLYKDTIRELLFDLKNGYAGNFKNKILIMAKDNDIKIPKKLLK